MMQGNPRVPYNPYNDWRLPAGHAAFARLLNAEMYFVAETHAKDAKYKRLRRTAVEFIEIHSTGWHTFDALIPYMAMTYVDRFLLKSKIPQVVRPNPRNVNLFLICCLTIAWKLRTKNFLLSNFLSERNLQYSVQNVIDMELHICRHLEWRIRTLTPFCFVDFYIPFLNLPPGSPFPLRSVHQLISKSQFDIAFTEIRPSVLAASATLIVCSKNFPGQFSIFETHIITSDLITPLRDMLYKCNRMLEPLYTGPSMPPVPVSTAVGDPERNPEEVLPGEASSSVMMQRSDPIPIKNTKPSQDPMGPGRLTGDKGEAEKTSMGPGLWMAAVPPNAEDKDREDAMLRYEEERRATRREGKQPATSEIDSEPEEIHGLLVDADYDELMNFELGWIEAQADADRRSGGNAGYGTYLVQKVTGSCSGFMQACNIL